MNLFCKAQRELLYKKMLQTKVYKSSLKASRKTSSHFHIFIHFAYILLYRKAHSRSNNNWVIRNFSKIP